MRYPKQEIKCDKCEGYGRVAIITSGPRLFEGWIRKPLPMTYAKAKQWLVNYKGNDGGALTILTRDLANNLDTIGCPWCGSSGISCTLQQLTPEEAVKERASR